MARSISQITVGSYSHFDPDSKVKLNQCCLFALCDDGTLWLMKDPTGDEPSEYWTELPAPPSPKTS